MAGERGTGKGPGGTVTDCSNTHQHQGVNQCRRRKVGEGVGVRGETNIDIEQGRALGQEKETEQVRCRQAGGEARSIGVACIAGPIWAFGPRAGQPAIAACIYGWSINGWSINTNRKTNMVSAGA